MCIIPEDIPVNIVFNRIQDIFILYDQWNQSLMDSRLRNASIQELLDLTASVIPNPIMLIGMDFTIIASRDWNLSDLSNSVLGSTENSWAIVDSLKQDPHYEEAFYKTGYFYYPGNGLAAPSLCVNISNNDKAVYRLMFSEGRFPWMIRLVLFWSTFPRWYPMHFPQVSCTAGIKLFLFIRFLCPF